MDVEKKKRHVVFAFFTDNLILPDVERIPIFFVGSGEVFVFGFLSLPKHLFFTSRFPHPTSHFPVWGRREFDGELP